MDLQFLEVLVNIYESYIIWACIINSSILCSASRSFEELSYACLIF